MYSASAALHVGVTHKRLQMTSPVAPRVSRMAASVQGGGFATFVTRKADPAISAKAISASGIGQWAAEWVAIVARRARPTRVRRDFGERNARRSYGALAL